MEPEFKTDEQPLVLLLQQLGQVEVAYPPDLLKKRRDAFLGMTLAAVAAHVVVAGIFKGLTTSAKEALLQGILATVLIAELAVGAYVLYVLKDEWLPLLKNNTPTPVLSSPQVVNTPIPIPTRVELSTGTPIETPITIGTEPFATNDTPHPGLHLGQTPGTPDSPGHEKDPPGHEKKP